MFEVDAALVNNHIVVKSVSGQPLVFMPIDKLIDICKSFPDSRIIQALSVSLLKNKSEVLSEYARQLNVE